MADQRAAPAALAIAMGAALAYLGYSLFQADTTAWLQLGVFAGYFLAGYGLTQYAISLLGVLTLLLIPGLPFAIALAGANIENYRLSPGVVIGLWCASIIMGALYAQLKPHKDKRPLTLLNTLTIGLVVLGLSRFFLM